MTLGLAQSDPRFRTGHGQLIGLAEWHDTRRLSVRDATPRAAAEAGTTIDAESLHGRVEELAERRVGRAAVHAQMKQLGYRFDARSRSWTAARGGAGERRA